MWNNYIMIKNKILKQCLYYQIYMFKKRELSPSTKTRSRYVIKEVSIDIRFLWYIRYHTSCSGTFWRHVYIYHKPCVRMKWLFIYFHAIWVKVATVYLVMATPLRYTGYCLRLLSRNSKEKWTHTAVFPSHSISKPNVSSRNISISHRKCYFIKFSFDNKLVRLDYLIKCV